MDRSDRVELGRAIYALTVLLHAYETDNRPPDYILSLAREVINKKRSYRPAELDPQEEKEWIEKTSAVLTGESDLLKE